MKKLKIKKIVPLNDDILLTADKYEEGDTGALIRDIKESSGCYKLHQKVIAVGPVVRSIKENDMVMINPIAYIKIEHPEDVNSLRETIKIRNTYTKVEFPIVVVDDKECMLLHSRDIKFVYEGDEIDEPTSK